MNQLLTSKIIKFLHDKSVKDFDSYMKFYQDYGVFIKEGIVINDDPKERVSILLDSILKQSSMIDLFNFVVLKFIESKLWVLDYF